MGKKDIIGETGLTAGDLVTAMQEAEAERERLAAKAARPGVIRQSRTTAFRLRRQLVPHTVIGLLWTGAQVCRWLPDSTTNAAAMYFVLAVVWWFVWGRKRDRSGNRRWRRRYSTLVMFSGGAWLLWAVSEGVSDWRTAALWVGGYALAAPYWIRNRLRIPDEQPAGPLWVPEPRIVHTATQLAWAEHIGGQGRFLDGSVLENPQETPFGEVYEGRLVRGKQRLASVTSNIDLICSGLDLDLDEVVVDRHPQGGQARFLLKIIDRAANPMHQMLPYPGPQYDRETGIVRLGTYADTEPAGFRLHVPGSGMFGGTVIGGTGAGKSRLLEGLASSAAHAVDEETGRGLYVVWVIDPQGGQSLPAWAKHADWAATDPGEIRLMLQAAERALEWRSKVNGLEDRGHFDPTPEMPGLLIIMDEAHKVLLPGSEEARILTTIAREGRKAGLAAVVADQYPGLQTFANDEALRSSLMIVNSIVMRTASKSSKGIIPGLEMDPFDLPPMPGSAYTVSKDGTGKTAPFKAFFVQEPMYWASTAPRTSLDPVSAAAAGEAYTDRHGRRERARQALRAQVDSLLSGKPVVLTTSRPAGAAASGGAAGPASTLLTVEVPSPKMAADADSGAIGRILAVIGAGAHRTGEINKRSGYSETWVRTMLKSLVSTGKVAKLAHGEYDLTDAGREYLAGIGGGDDTLRAAVQAVATQQSVSPAFLQRELRVDLATAVHLLEDLHQLGVVGPGDGLQAREVLVSPDDVPAVLDHLSAASVA